VKSVSPWFWFATKRRRKSPKKVKAWRQGMLNVVLKETFLSNLLQSTTSSISRETMLDILYTNDISFIVSYALYRMPPFQLPLSKSFQPFWTSSSPLPNLIPVSIGQSFYSAEASFFKQIFAPTGKVGAYALQMSQVPPLLRRELACRRQLVPTLVKKTALCWSSEWNEDVFSQFYNDFRPMHFRHCAVKALLLSHL
jgi:hypothetical protein